MKPFRSVISLALGVLLCSGGDVQAQLGGVAATQAQQLSRAAPRRRMRTGRHLFVRETFGGNGRTCATCHSHATGTVSPADAQRRFDHNPDDPLFIADGSDDGQGHGVSRMLEDATILVQVPLAPNVRLLSDPAARSVTLVRGIPTVKNTPALDPVLMLDGRAPDLLEQALGAITGHAAATIIPLPEELERIARFERGLFSSPSLRLLARGRSGLELPAGTTDAERRGRRFFEDRVDAVDPLVGACAGCHSGPLLNETNEFIPVPPFGRGGRFQNVLVSELNTAGNPVLDFEFTDPGGNIRVVHSPDPGRALITGDASDSPENMNAFKIPILRGVRLTAPYFHDNSAKTLADVARHYKTVFDTFTNGDVILGEQDQADLVAFMELL